MSPDKILDFIANHTRELAKMAEDAKQEVLAHALRIAELEARKKLGSKKRKNRE
jgi:hypothetical protein